MGNGLHGNLQRLHTDPPRTRNEGNLFVNQDQPTVSKYVMQQLKLHKLQGEKRNYVTFLIETAFFPRGQTFSTAVFLIKQFCGKEPYDVNIPTILPFRDICKVLTAFETFCRYISMSPLIKLQVHNKYVSPNETTSNIHSVYLKLAYSSMKAES